jgi:hypothetical protein
MLAQKLALHVTDAYKAVQDRNTSFIGKRPMYRKSLAQTCATSKLDTLLRFLADLLTLAIVYLSGRIFGLSGQSGCQEVVDIVIPRS